MINASAPKEVERRREEIAKRARTHARIAATKIKGKIDDAYAHGIAGFTATLVDAPAGKPTARGTRNSRSIQAGLTRIDELHAWLAGPSRESQDGWIRDAWEEIYTDCRAYWSKAIDPNYLRPNSREATKPEIRRVRAAIILGYDAREAVEGAIATAKRGLRTKVANLASPTYSAKDRREGLDAWRRASVAAISKQAELVILGGAYYLDRVAARDVLKPEFREDDPTIPD